MEKFTIPENHTVVRIGVAPFYPSINECVLNKTMTSKCRKNVGIELEILLTVFDLLNLTAVFIKAPAVQCGDVQRFPNGSWTASGLLQMVMQREIDITGNICSLNADRVFFMNMSYPVYFAKQLFIVKKPVVEYHFDVWAPLQINVWLPFIVLIAAQGSILGLILIAKRMGLHYAALQQVSQTMEYMCEITIGWLFALYSSYVMISFMYPKAKSIPFQSGNQLSELMLNGEYKYSSFRDPPALPEAASGKVRQRFQDAINKYGFEHTGNKPEQIYDSLLTDYRKMVAIRSDVWVLQDFNEMKDHTRFETIEDRDVGSSWKGYYWMSNFSHRNAINYFLSLSTGGLVPTIRRRYLPRAYLQDLPPGDVKKAIRIDQFADLFTMYAGCLVASILLAGGERFYQFLQFRKQKTQQEYIYRF